MNSTQNGTVTNGTDEPGEVYRITWLVGISVSVVGLVVKIFVFFLIPKCRKFDEIVLLQMTVARTLNTICEYSIMFITLSNVIIKDAVFTTYMQTDLVLLLWMFVFSKNIYNKVVLVFGVEKPSLSLRTVIIWTVTLPVGLLCPFLLKIGHFYIYYQIYAHVKLLVIVVNSLIFLRIFNVAARRGSSSSRNIKDLIKTAIVAFILICITSLQVFLTDILSFYYHRFTTLVNLFCVINSFQVIAISIIFFSLVKSKTNDKVIRSVSLKLREFVQSD